MLNGQSPVGFIGLGAMGASLARRLLSAGATLHVNDIDAAAVQRMVALGATAQPSPRAVADHAEVVIACLPNGSICRHVALGIDGVSAGQKVRTYVECSTIGRAAVLGIASDLVAKGIAFVDSPISGGPKGADSGTLSVMASGSAAALATAMPYLRQFGKKVYEVGAEPGMAQMMKLVNNLISAANMASSFEAFVLGAKAGLDPENDGRGGECEHWPQHRHRDEAARLHPHGQVRLRRARGRDLQGRAARSG